MTHAKRRAHKVLYITSEGKRKYGSYEGFQSIQRFGQKITYSCSESIREDAELTGENEIINVRSSDRVSNDGEFDPGSERTLAARFKHASRAAAAMRERRTGE